MTDAVIYDRGYRRYEGERRGRAAIRRSIVADGIRRILGLRRKARRKILPWGLLATGVLMGAVLIGLHFAAGSIDEAFRQGLPSYGQLFDLYSRIALLFVAITGPELLGPDRAQGVLSVYFSRPMSAADYVRAKGTAYLSMALGIYLVPQLAFHLGMAALADEGFVAYLTGNLDILWKVGLVALCFAAVHGGALAVLSSHIDRTPFAAAAFLGVFIAGGNIALVLTTSDVPGARWFSLLAFDDHARFVRDRIFDIDLGRYAPEVAGFDPWVSGLAIAAVALGGAAWTLVRYRRLA